MSAAGVSEAASGAANAAPAGAIGNGTIPTVSLPVDRVVSAQSSLIAEARKLDAAEHAAANPAPAPEVEAKPTDAKPEGEKPAKKPVPHTVTARLADLSAQLRETNAKLAAERSRATQLDAALAEAKRGGVQLEAIRAAFKADPLTALEQLGEKWQDIVDRVANGGAGPTPEQVAAAERERKENERDNRLKALEEERAAEKKAADEAKAAEAQANAVKYIASQMITADKYPALVGISEDAAAEAIDAVDEALRDAHKGGKRATPHPVDVNESVKLTHLALKGLNSYYQDLSQRLSPKSPQQSNGVPGAAASTPAVSAPASSQPVVAEQQSRRPITTITHSVAAGETPLAAQPKRLSAAEAQAEVIAAARRLPAL